MVLRLLNSRLGAAGFWDEWDKAFLSDDWSHWRENIVPHKEHEDHYEYWINLAGFKKENVEAVIHESMVAIKAEKDGSTSNHSFHLNDDADVSTLSSKLEDGLLTIKVNKRKEAMPTKIKIQ